MAILVAAAACFAAPASAQIYPPPTPSPGPSASPGASPAPTPAPTPTPTPAPPRITVAADAHVMFISQNTNGYGQLGLPEAPNFANGTSPAAPNAPYDTF